MTGKRGNREPPLSLDMSFNEAFARFAQTSPRETKELEKATIEKRRVTGLSPATSLLHNDDPDRLAANTASAPINPPQREG